MKSNGFDNLETNRREQSCIVSKQSNQLSANPPQPANGEMDGGQKIEQSIAYMLKHLDEPLQVSKLAQQVNISPSHYFALFKRRTGSAPIGYFIRLRMQHARDLLEGTPASVKEIAATLGYNDPFYFSRVFKSVNRVAPKEYRARHERNFGTKTGSATVTANFSRAERSLKFSINGVLAIAG